MLSWCTGCSRHMRMPLRANSFKLALQSSRQATKPLQLLFSSVDRSMYQTAQAAQVHENAIETKQLQARFAELQASYSASAVVMFVTCEEAWTMVGCIGCSRHMRTPLKPKSHKPALQHCKHASVMLEMLLVLGGSEIQSTY